MVLSSLAITATHTQYYFILYRLALRHLFRPAHILALIGFMLTLDVLVLALSIVISVRIAEVKDMLSIAVQPFRTLAIVLSAVYLVDETLITCSIAYLILREKTRLYCFRCA